MRPIDRIRMRKAMAELHVALNPQGGVTRRDTERTYYTAEAVERVTDHVLPERTTAMLTTTHSLSSREADDIKRALLDAARAVPCGPREASDPVWLARGLIEAFRLVEEATSPRPAASSKE